MTLHQDHQELCRKKNSSRKTWKQPTIVHQVYQFTQLVESIKSAKSQSDWQQLYFSAWLPDHLKHTWVGKHTSKWLNGVILVITKNKMSFVLYLKVNIIFSPFSPITVFNLEYYSYAVMLTTHWPCNYWCRLDMKVTRDFLPLYLSRLIAVVHLSVAIQSPPLSLLFMLHDFLHFIILCKVQLASSPVCCS